MVGVYHRKTYSEIYEILNILGEDFINKIPKKLYYLFEKEMDKEYKPNLIGKDGLIDETKISQETIALFSVLNIKYFIEDDEEKRKLLEIYRKNEEIYQTKLREKYNPDNIFNNNSKESLENIPENNQEKSLVDVQKIKWYKKIWQKITATFCSKRF